MPDNGVGGREGFIVELQIKAVGGDVGTKRAANLNRTNWSTVGRAAAQIVDHFTKCCSESSFKNSAACNVAGQLQHLRATASSNTKRCVCCCAVGEDCRHCAKAENVVDHCWFTE